MKNVENEPMSTLQVLTLVENFMLALLTKTRSGNSAKKLISQEKKIESLVRGFLGTPLRYNFFENKMFLSGWFADDNSCPEDKETEMTVKQALKISKIFGKALGSNSCSETEAEKLIKDKEKLASLADDLFEMSPAFNLFEYNRYVRRAPLSAFKEVCAWNGGTVIVCTADEVCEPYGFKSGERVYSPHGICGIYGTILGVAPYPSPLHPDEDPLLAIWVADDGLQFKNPSKTTADAWPQRNFKEARFVSTTH